MHDFNGTLTSNLINNKNKNENNNNNNNNNNNKNDNNNNNNNNNKSNNNYKRVRLQLQECLDSGFVLSWLNRERTSLLQKEKSKGNVASNYRPITCSPLM